MNLIKKFVVMLLFISICLTNADIAYAVGISSDTKDSYIYKGILERTSNCKNEERKDYYLDTLNIEKACKVNVKVELDKEYPESYSGGMVQVALTKDEAHCHLIDNVWLLPAEPETKESFTLYPGEYTVEVHLLREEPAVVPFQVSVTVVEDAKIPAYDKEASVWFPSEAYLCKIDSHKNVVYDMFSVLRVSSWFQQERCDFVYQSSNTSVATIDSDGYLKSRKPGKTVITVTYPNGDEAVTTVYVRR